MKRKKRTKDIECPFCSQTYYGPADAPLPSYCGYCMKRVRAEEWIVECEEENPKEPPILTFYNRRNKTFTDVYSQSGGRGFWYRIRDYKGRYISGATGIYDEGVEDVVEYGIERGFIKVISGEFPLF